MTNKQTISVNDQRLGWALTLPLLAVLVSSSFSVFAQESKDSEPPTPPFLSDAKDPITIIRTFEIATAQSKISPKDPNQLVVTTSTTEIYGPVRRVLKTYAGKSKPGEFWSSNGLMVGDDPRSAGYVFVDGGVSTDGGSDLVAVFPEASWVNSGNFVKWDKVDGRRCRLHQANIPPHLNPIGQANPNILYGPVTVWIADDTRLPVKAKTQYDTITFTYGPPPIAPLVMPQHYVELLKSMKDGPNGQMR